MNKYSYLVEVTKEYENLCNQELQKKIAGVPIPQILSAVVFLAAPLVSGYIESSRHDFKNAINNAKDILTDIQAYRSSYGYEADANAIKDELNTAENKLKQILPLLSKFQDKSSEDLLKENPQILSQFISLGRETYTAVATLNSAATSREGFVGKIENTISPWLLGARTNHKELILRTSDFITSLNILLDRAEKANTKIQSKLQEQSNKPAALPQSLDQEIDTTHTLSSGISTDNLEDTMKEISKINI